MSLYRRNYPEPPVGLTEFEILKASHKFLRDEDELEPGEPSQALTTTDTADQDALGPSNTSSWNDQLAAKYYTSLYREFALCDLKHYKSGNFALRWRTEDEVFSGAGETTCGNTRCENHHLPHGSSSSRLDPPSSSSSSKGKKVQLTTLELPFGYVEHGKSKSALVKVVLCGRCLKKLMWKRNKDKEQERPGDADDGHLENERKSRGDQEMERERLEKSKRKRDRDSVSEAEGPLQSPLREDRSISKRPDQATPERRETFDRSGKRRRSRSPSHSRSKSRFTDNHKLHRS